MSDDIKDTILVRGAIEHARGKHRGPIQFSWNDTVAFVDALERLSAPAPQGLQALVERWKKEASQFVTSTRNYCAEYATARGDCATELEALLAASPPQQSASLDLRREKDPYEHIAAPNVVTANTSSAHRETVLDPVALEAAAKRVCDVMHSRPGFAPEACAKGDEIARACITAYLGASKSRGSDR